MSEASETAASSRWGFTKWLIVVIAVIGFAYDIYALLVMPLIARPALSELLHVDLNTASGTQAVLAWTGYITWSSAICGGVFGLLGGYLTDRFGRRSILTWSILIYAVSAFASGFVTDALTLLILRCTTFIGVCVEFVAAVAWLAELFPDPKERESVLGYTQAFSSIGGLMVSGAYLFISQNATSFPAIYGEHSPWRYALISAVIPVLPLIVIRPFLPESPVWKRKQAEGTLQRPSIGQLFQPMFLQTTIVTAALFACAYGAAFGAIQMTPQIVPGLVPELRDLRGLLTSYEGATHPDRLAKLKAAAETAKKNYDEAHPTGPPENPKVDLTARALLQAMKQYKDADAASQDSGKREEMKQKIEELEKTREASVAGVQIYQEVGGLVGRFVLAFLALRIVSRRALLRVFQLPGLIVLPLVYFFPAAGNLSSNNIEWLRGGIFFAGFFTVAQLSFWGNYLPRMYPVYLRGTGESFAANVGGRMVGTSAQLLATTLGGVIISAAPLLPPPTSIAYAAAIVGFLVYGIGSILTNWLPEPKEEFSHE